MHGGDAPVDRPGLGDRQHGNAHATGGTDAFVHRGEPLAVDNPLDGGVRALAQVLGHQGVQVREMRSLADAVASAQAGTTLAVVGTFELDQEDLAALAGTDEIGRAHV